MTIEFTSGVLFKVGLMTAKQLYLVMLLLLIGCQHAGIGQDKPALPAETVSTPLETERKKPLTGSTETELDRQLKIYKSTLLEGKDEQIRIDAATELLFSEEPLARGILLAALKQSENSAARVAVCKALSQARASQEIKNIRQKGDFIQPLLGILTTEEDFARAKLAAEAILIFEYGQIQEQLEEIVTDSSLPAKARLNAIYALKLRPDMETIFKLMDLLDDSDNQVAAEAEKALKSVGIPVGKDAETRRQIRNELERKGRDRFLQDWLIQQETRMHKLEAELSLWRQLYLSSLDKIYDGLSDDEARGKFLAEHLTDSKAVVKLWVLEKVHQNRLKPKYKLPVELGPILVNLIPDQDRDVRLKTAKLLSLMVDLNSAGRLLKQLEIEQNNEVRMELFAALGGACHYAFLPDSGIKIREEIRKEALEWAAKFLFEQEANKAQKGAEVMKKLLEQAGLGPNDVEKYLGLLVKRYEQEKDKADGALRGELLGAMAGLCAQNAYKAQSTKLFRPLFEKALRDETDLVREAAVAGLIYIDKARALIILRNFVNDSSITARKKIIELAGEVGGRDDLVWLAEKLASSAESELVWQGMLKIFKRSEAAVLAEWMAKFDSPTTKARLSDEQKASFLGILERKAVSENNLKMLKTVREKLAQIYSKIGEFERAAEYFGMLREAAETDEEQERILANLLEAYLRLPNVELAASLIDNRLLEKDLEPNDIVVCSIDSYLLKPPSGVDPNVVLGTLFAKIKCPEDRPRWAEQLKRWSGRFDQAKKPDKPREAGN